MSAIMSEEDRVKEVIVESRIQKVLSLRTDSIVMLEALDAISDFYTTNDAESRKNLRSNLELQNIENAKHFLDQMQVIKQKLDVAESLSTTLQNSCQMLSKRVQEADANMKNFIEKAASLETQRVSLQTQASELKSFLNRFHLSNEEISLLQVSSLDHPTHSKQFFQILQRLKVAYLDCQQLSVHAGYAVGFELLDSLGRHQDTAYEQLFQWVQAKCTYLSDLSQSAPHVLEDHELNNRLQLAISYLREVDVYYAQVQDLLISARRSQLLQKFILVLTQGDSSQKHARPLDLLSPDPLPYLSSMLAYIHQLVAAEKEFVYAIFPPQTQANTHAGTHSPAPVLGGLTTEEVLARCVSGLGKPLRVRVAQVLERGGGADARSGGGGVGGVDVYYAVADLLTFYLSTIHKILPSENAVTSTLRGSLGECKRIFHRSLRSVGEGLAAAALFPSADLKVVTVAREHIYLLASLLRIYRGALSDVFEKPASAAAEAGNAGDGEAAAAGAGDLYIEHVGGEVLSQLLQACRKGAGALAQGDLAVYMLNTINAVQHELRSIESPSAAPASAPSATPWHSLLQAEHVSWAEIVVHEEYLRYIKRCDMDKVLDMLEVLPASLRGCEQIGLSREKIVQVVRGFYMALFSGVGSGVGGGVGNNGVERIQDPAVREEVRAKVARAIGEAYRKVHALVSNPFHGYDPSILTHSVEEVYLLLGGTSAQ